MLQLKNVNTHNTHTCTITHRHTITRWYTRTLFLYASRGNSTPERGQSNILIYYLRPTNFFWSEQNYPSFSIVSTHIHAHTNAYNPSQHPPPPLPITASLPMGPHFQRPSLENRDARRSCEWFFLWKYIRARCECHDLTEFLLNSIGPTDPLFQPCTTLESWVFACNSLFEYLNKMRMAFADR